MIHSIHLSQSIILSHIHQDFDDSGLKTESARSPHSSGIISLIFHPRSSSAIILLMSI